VKQPIFRFLLWTTVIGTVLLGLTEAALWGLAPVGKRVSQRWEFDNQLPGLKERVSFTVDSRSLRSWRPKPPATAPDTGREITVLVLGGGGTMATLQNNEDAWWGRLATLLQEETPPARIQVHALLREYCTILQAAKWTEQHIESLKPDVIIAAFGFEDVLSRPGDYTYSPDTLASLSLESKQRHPAAEFLIETSQLCRRYVNRGQKRALMAQLGPLSERNAYAQRLAQLRQIHAQLPLAYEVPRPEGRDPLPEYLDGIRALHSLSQNHGASLVVVGEPTLRRGLMDGGAEQLVHRWFMLDPAKDDAGAVRLDSGWIELELSRYFTAAETLCQTLGVPFTDPTRKLPANPLVFVDDLMLTDSGATALARAVLPLVRPLVETRVSE